MQALKEDGFDTARLRRLASDLAVQFVHVDRVWPGTYSRVCLFGSRPEELRWLATEVTERLWSVTARGVSVEVVADMPAPREGQYCIDVDYFLNHHCSV